MKVPEPVRVLFENFPIETYPPVANESVHSTNLEQSIKYPFLGTDQLNALFSLGVFGVYEYKNKVLPTDPLSLGYSLILADRNKFKLPRELSSKGSQSLLMVLSYHASSNNQLPMLIEDQIEESPLRMVKTTKSLRKVVTKGMDASQLAIADLIDSYYDLWLMCLAIEGVGFDTTFNIEGTAVQRADIWSALLSWHGFKDRQPALFAQSHKLSKTLITDLWQGINLDHLSHYYSIRLGQYDQDLQLYANELEKIQNNTVLLLKLAGYLVVFTTILEGSRISDISSKHTKLVEWARSVVEKY